MYGSTFDLEKSVLGALQGMAVLKNSFTQNCESAKLMCQNRTRATDETDNLRN